MSDAASAFGSNLGELNGLPLAQLSCKEYGTLEAAARNRSRQNLLALLDDVKADAANKIALLKDFDVRLPRLSHTASHLETAEGAAAAVRMSLMRAGADKAAAEAAMEGVGIVQMSELAMKVTTLNKLFEPAPPPPTKTGKNEPDDKGSGGEKNAVGE